jgi:kinesin family protein 3/17
MPSETVKVMVRVRPINSREKDKRCTIVVEVDGPNNNIILTNPEESDTQKVFSYDAVFASNCL